MAILIQLTTAGLAAVTAAAGTNETLIAELGLSDQPFVAAPTLTALPGQFKRLPILSGVAPAPNVIHVTAYDQSADVWNATGFGFFLEDGTLFAAYSSDEPVLSKAALAFALMAFDIALNADLTAEITFGDATFVWPPATEAARGIAKLATQAEVTAGTDGEKIVTPSKLKVVLDALSATLTASIAAVNAGVNALRAITVTGAGLASGGGALTANRTITVTEASAEQITDGTASDVVVTPRRLGPVTMLLEENGFIRVFGLQIAWGRFNAGANGSTAVNFAQPFPVACFAAVPSGVLGSGTDSKDNAPGVVSSTITKNGFSVFSADDSSVGCCYIAVGR